MLINRLLHDFQKLRILLGVGDRSLCELTQYLKNTKLVIRGLEVPELIFGRTIILKISHIYYVKPIMISLYISSISIICQWGQGASGKPIQR